MLENENPTVRIIDRRQKAFERPLGAADIDDSITDPLTAAEIFDMIRDINDPEHPLTLEQLSVVQEADIALNAEGDHVTVLFTPTVPHCSMASLIGLSIVVRLRRSLPLRIKTRVCVRAGTHSNEHHINRQLNDKERVAAAAENSALLDAVNAVLAPAIC